MVLYNLLFLDLMCIPLLKFEALIILVIQTIFTVILLEVNRLLVDGRSKVALRRFDLTSHLWFVVFFKVSVQALQDLC